MDVCLVINLCIVSGRLSVKLQCCILCSGFITSIVDAIFGKGGIATFQVSERFLDAFP